MTCISNCSSKYSTEGVEFTRSGMGSPENAAN